LTIRNTTSLVLATVLTGILALTPTARAGGLYVSDFGTPAMGTAGAGINARASDASTALHNSAGMTRLDSHQLMLGLAPGWATVKFDADSDSPSGGGDGGDQGGLVPIMSATYVHKLSDRWRFGLALASISGAALDPDNDWAGRNELAKIQLFTLSVMPSIAFQVTDWLSFGAGPVLTYARLDWDLFAPLPGPGAGEAKVKLDDADDIQPAANLSVHIQPRSDLRIGVVYQSKTDFDLDGDATIPAGVSAGIGIGLPLAQFVRGSIYWDATDRLAVLASADWEDWSQAGNIPVSIADGDTKVPLGFHDTWKAALGFHYKLNDAWTVQTGFAYDSSAVNTKDRITALPVDRQLRVGVGTIHQYSETTQLGFGFLWVDLGDARVNNSVVKGDYERQQIFLLSLNVNWSKLPWAGRGTFRSE